MNVSYANEDFDTTQALATELTEQDRAAGRTAPKVGYSAPNWDRAQSAVRACRTEREARAALGLAA